MNEKERLIQILEHAIDILKTNGKSQDIADLFWHLDDMPGLLHDFFIEVSLCANPEEEVGLCFSVERIAAALEEFKQTGTTNLLEGSRK